MTSVKENLRTAELLAEVERLRRANERLAESERDKFVLLSISRDIATARNALELLQAIREKAQLLIPFYDTGVLIVEPNGEHHYDLVVTVEDWDASEGNRFLQEQGLNHIPHPNSFLEQMMQRLEDYSTPVIEDWEHIFKTHDHPFFPLMRKSGYKEALVTTLKSGGKTFGTLWLNSLEKNHFNIKQFEIFQSLADQVAVAVANILANEEILRLAEERRERAEELSKANQALARTSARLLEQPDLAAFLSQVLIEVVKQSNANIGLLTILNEQRNAFETAVLFENGNIIPVDLEPLLASDQMSSKAGFIRILSQTLRPGYFDIEREPDLLWHGTVEYLRARGQKSVLAFQLSAGNKLMGVIGLAFSRLAPVTEQQSEFINSLTHQAALAILLTKLANEARCKGEESAVLEERNRIAREIHDTLAQTFTGIVVQLEAGKRILPDEQEKTVQHLERASSLAREGLAEARRSVQALRPLALENTDLPTTLAEFVERMTGGTNVKGEFRTSGKFIVFAPGVNTNLLRIAQEAVTNAMRHAKPSEILVELDYEENGIRLRVRDDGCGFDTELERPGFGLIGMRERARSINAKLEVTSRKNVGTDITVTAYKETSLADSNKIKLSGL